MRHSSLVLVLFFCYIYLHLWLVDSLFSSYWTVKRAFFLRFSEDLSSKKGQASGGFMSSGFILAVIGAPLKLSIVYVSFSLFLILSEFVFSGFASWCMLRGILSHNSVKPSVSMRLRPKRFVCLVFVFSLSLFSGIGLMFFFWFWNRTCCGVECYGGFHIQRFSYLFIFLRGDFT